ncbi:unnamed protein product, partial [Polarella glacialis]
VLVAGAQAVLKHVGMTQDQSKRPIENLLPLENLWVSNQVSANVCILTLRGLRLEKDVRLKPYIAIKFAGSDKRLHTQDATDVHDNNQGADFYYNYTVNAVLPGPSSLQIQVWNRSPSLGLADTMLGTNHSLGLADEKMRIRLGDTMIGYTEIDLEDRWLTLYQKKLRAVTNRAFLMRSVSPDPFETDVVPRKAPKSQGQDSTARELAEVAPSAGRMSAKIGEVTGGALERVKVAVRPLSIGENNKEDEENKPSLAPTDPLPIETKFLQYEESQLSEQTAGTMRLW